MRTSLEATWCNIDHDGPEAEHSVGGREQVIQDRTHLKVLLLARLNWKRSWRVMSRRRFGPLFLIVV
jgi:hypothetical protein